ncbi:glycoside hydrolase family 6 protein [Nocardioides acrostichi]|uniref:Glucanase n=1 Tax=Nocardioides acrostichi TaxID=2784339 RepID=A0A930V411_9ACTN|nr:glycoside hydrolase family 6 protein [Nocardioides acrostichi]MBF4163456.1 glycoside hydrolase family 6 protein [Nocardioides acrostichi]
MRISGRRYRPTLPTAPVVVAGLMLTTVLSALTAVVAPGQATASGTDPRLRLPFKVNTDSQAYSISRDKPVFRPIGDQPTAYWLSPEYFPLGTVRRQVSRYADRAAAHDRIPLVSLYGIPHRDCGGYSAGGWSPRQYRTWTTRIARGLAGTHAVAVVEPDALGLMDNCPGQTHGRLRLVRHAVRALASHGVWAYVDAGHVGWVPPWRMARRLKAAGVGMARGYSVNVMSYASTRDSRHYATAVGRRLESRGVDGTHYLVGTAVNGNPQKIPTDWCNPDHMRLGAPPRIVAGPRLDRTAWISEPGGSAGPCNGGPPAGVFWKKYALMLLGKRDSIFD